jgi:hypothetical protein
VQKKKIKVKTETTGSNGTHMERTIWKEDEEDLWDKWRGLVT